MDNRKWLAYQWASHLLYYRFYNLFTTTYMPTEKLFEVKRVLPLPICILENLEERKTDINLIKAYSENFQDHDLVCCQFKGTSKGNYKGLSSLNTAMRRICEKAKLPHLSPEALRDVYAMLFLQSKEGTLEKLSANMGYSSVKDVYERYSSFVEQNQDIAGLMGKVYQNL